jgi:hypothetical protein
MPPRPSAPGVCACEIYTNLTAAAVCCTVTDAFGGSAIDALSHRPFNELDMKRRAFVETNPYAPPKSHVTDLSSAGLKRRSVIVMIAFSILTLGLYFPIWFLRRRAALNRLDSPRKLQQWPFVLAIVWFVFQFLAGVAAGLSPSEQSLQARAPLLFLIVRLAVGILIVVQSFFVKDILEDHLAGPDDQAPRPLFADAVQLSGVMTFLFQIYYLQYAINRYLAGSKSSPV